MRQAMSLEEEKQRLLEQFENSRVVYRRMLTGAETPSYEEETPSPSTYSHSGWHSGGFPQSSTMQWIMRHPYLFAAGAVALAYAGKKGISKTRSQTASQPANDDNAALKKGIAATTLGTSLATAAAMALKNPGQMQAMMRAIGMAANFYKSRRRNP